MTVTKSTIELIADLAQIDIPEQSKESYVRELSNILEMIQQMQQIDTSNTEPMSHPLDIQLRLRPDEVTESDQSHELLQVAPTTEDRLYLVPKVID